MSRAAIFISLLFICACTRNDANVPALPESAAGGWQRKSMEKVASGRWLAEYEGPGAVHLEISAVAHGAVGLDMVQKWRPLADTVVFSTEKYFVVVRWEDTNREALRGLIARLQRDL